MSSLLKRIYKNYDWGSGGLLSVDVGFSKDSGSEKKAITSKI